jgi:hypothetical protein
VRPPPPRFVTPTLDTAFAIELRSGAGVLLVDRLAEPPAKENQMSVRFPVHLGPAAANTSFRITGLALVALAAGLLSACSTGSPAGAANSGQSNGGGAQPASSGGGAQQASSGGGSVADGLGHPVNVCSLLPAATAASLSGEPITEAQEQDTPGYKIYDCSYTSADGTSGFDISVLAEDAAIGYDANVQSNSSVVAIHQISGLGDKAFSSITGLEALFGNVSITVSNLQSDSAAEALIRALQPKL